jgi:hypothetical protein
VRTISRKDRRKPESSETNTPDLSYRGKIESDLTGDGKSRVGDNPAPERE